MSIPSLLHGSSLNCGPDNPLASLSKSFHQDRSLYQDGFHSLPPSQPSHSNLTIDGIQPHDLVSPEEQRFFELKHQQPFDLSNVHQELSSIHLNQPARSALRPAHDWSAAFLKSAPIPAHPSLGWQNEFIRSRNLPQTTQRGASDDARAHHNKSIIHRPISTGLPRLSGIAGLGLPALTHPAPIGLHPQTPTDQQANLPKNDLAWDSAFLQIARNASSLTTETQASRSESQETSHDYQDRSHSPQSSASPDLLARVAGSLIATVSQRQHTQAQPGLAQQDIDGGAHSLTDDKFSNSSFMDLMRKLRDGEVKVEGDKVVKQVVPAQLNAPVDVKGKRSAIESEPVQSGPGGVWASDYAHGIQSSEIQGPSQFTPSSAVPQPTGVSVDPQSALTAAKQELEGRMREMSAFFEETDADIQHARYRAAMNRFQGDGGVADPDLEEILKAASEVDRPEGQAWMNTHVPGATEQWSEEFEQSMAEQQDGDFDESGMFGRPLSIHELELERLKRSQRVPSLQQREWEVLQDDWEESREEESSRVESLPQSELVERVKSLAAQTGYDFQGLNRYALQHERATSRHHSVHAQLDNPTLAQAHHGPLDSVLLKESEVLRSPESASAWLELGVKQQENEREDMAIRALRKATELDPELSEAILALAISYTNENRRAEAFEEIERWIKVEMNKVSKYRVVLARTPASSEASVRDPSQQVDQLAQKHQILTGTLIQLARLGGRVEGSASVDPDVQIALGVLFNTNEEFEKASDCFSAALSVRPEDPLLFNRLGATLANGGKSDEALEYYIRALELQPTYIRARYNLSISLINLGRYESAAMNLMEALEMQESDSVHLGETLKAMDGAEYKDNMEEGSKSHRSGVTSQVLWETLEIGCSLLSRLDLSEYFRNKDLKGLKANLQFPSS